MKLNDIKQVFHTNIEEEDSTEFGIGDESIVIEILRNRLYENKIQTLTQEYMCNARDAHRESGQTKKIQVTFPTRYNLDFKVRDFGPGITPDRMKNVFVLYGASTKRANNKQTGGFGIGAKSAWSYTNSFTITTYVDGVERIYVAHIGESNKGSVSKISENPTSEPNGTMITISVKQHDVSAFCAAIIRSSMYWLDSEYPEFKNSENHLNALIESRKIGTARFMGTNMSGMSDNRYTNNRNHTIVIDGVPYPMPNITVAGVGTLVNAGGSYNLVVVVPNGLLQVSASREKIDDSDISKKALNQIFEAAVADFKAAKERWEDEIVDGKTLLEAREKMAGFVLSTKKNIDLVGLHHGELQLTMNRTVDGVQQRLFAGRRYDHYSKSRDAFSLKSNNKYFMVKTGDAKVTDIQEWIKNHPSISQIDVLHILAQKERVETINGQRIVHFERDEELVKELVTTLTKLGMKDIGPEVPKKPKAPRGPSADRLQGGVYLFNQYGDESVAALDKLKHKGIWLYYIGRKNTRQENYQWELMNYLIKAGEAQYAFRIIQAKEEAVKQDGRFVSMDDFFNSWVPNKNTLLGMLTISSQYNALNNLHLNMADKNSPLFKAVASIVNRNELKANYNFRNKVMNTPQFKELSDGVGNILQFVRNQIPLIDWKIQQNTHNKEYISWALEKAKQDNVDLKIPNILL